MEPPLTDEVMVFTSQSHNTEYVTCHSSNSCMSLYRSLSVQQSHCASTIHLGSHPAARLGPVTVLKCRLFPCAVEEWHWTGLHAAIQCLLPVLIHARENGSRKFSSKSTVKGPTELHSDLVHQSVIWPLTRASECVYILHTVHGEWCMRPWRHRQFPARIGVL